MPPLGEAITSSPEWPKSSMPLILSPWKGTQRVTTEPLPNRTTSPAWCADVDCADNVPGQSNRPMTSNKPNVILRICLSFPTLDKPKPRNLIKSMNWRSSASLSRKGCQFGLTTAFQSTRTAHMATPPFIIKTIRETAKHRQSPRRHKVQTATSKRSFRAPRTYNPADGHSPVERPSATLFYAARRRQA